MPHSVLIDQPNSSLGMKVFDALILSLTFSFSTLAIGAEAQAVIVAVGGSFSGAVILAYFRRDSRKIEQAFKVACSSVTGLVCGAAIQEYFKFENLKYVLFAYFISGMLSLVILRALLNLSERNAGQICKDLLQRMLNLQIKEEEAKRVRQRRRRIRRPEDQGRYITLEDTKPPEKELNK